jgi:pimeloyl-ACP methyl ester carboxylesterase
MIIRPKHIALTSITLIFVSFLFWVNYQWGNSIEQCFWMSFLTFWLIFSLFAFYWEIRDFWQYRWTNIDYSNVTIESIQIPVGNNGQFLAGEYLYPNSQSNDEEKSAENLPIIVFTHGFSDDKYKIRHLTVPLALMGYHIIAYDCRGTGQSKKIGKKTQFSKISEDLGEIIEFVSNNDRFTSHPIYLIGTSLGAMASLIQGIRFSQVEKIISIAGISQYKDLWPRSPIPFKGNWWVWLRFKLLGVDVNPPENIAIKISPYIQLQQDELNYSSNAQWSAYTNQKIFLVHAENDKMIPLKQFKENREICMLTPDNWLISKKGGHMFQKYELILLAAFRYFLEK